MELRDKFQPITIKDTKFPDPKEVYDYQLMVKDGQLYIMFDGKWYLVNSLTEV